MRLIIKSVPQNIAQIERYLGELFSEHQLDTNMYPDMLISLTEAVNNAMVHGNELDKQKEVSVRSSVMSDHIRFKISDEGEGFNPKELPDPCCDDNIMTAGGRGVMLMRALSSEVYFTNGGATVELVFRRR
jgi:serine/threonine-protein kinase RsbW